MSPTALVLIMRIWVVTKWPDLHELTVLTEAVHIWWYIFFSWRTDELKAEAALRVEWKVTNDVLDEDTFQPSKSDYYYFVLLFLTYFFLKISGADAFAWIHIGSRNGLFYCLHLTSEYTSANWLSCANIINNNTKTQETEMGINFPSPDSSSYMVWLN